MTQAAKFFCERSGWSLTNLALQKIIYIAHMVHMGENDGARLVNETFEAWDYGPVSPRLYARVRVFGADPVRNVFHGTPVVTDKLALAQLESSAKALLHKRPAELVALTHWPKGAWAKNYRPGALHIPIPDADILDEYRARIATRAA